MISPESQQPERLQPIEPTEWERLCKQLEKRRALAERVGIEVDYLIVDGAKRENTEGKGVDDVLFGASLGKLGIAKVAIDLHLDPEAIKVWDPALRDGTGSGFYDQERAPHSAMIADLVSDMLGRSGNTPLRVLSPLLGGAEAINAHYMQKGYQRTRVFPGEEGNRVFLGPTTPREALMMLEDIFQGPETDLASIAQDSLRLNRITNQGIRRSVRGTYLGIINKTGNYHGDDADPYSVAHDVGIVESVSRKRKLKYAIMTKSPRSDRGIKSAKAAAVRLFAEWTVGRMGAEIANTVEGYRIDELGKRAMWY